MERRDRATADRRARELLCKTITGDGDLLEVLQLWRFKPNRTRKNVVPEGVPFVFSETLGLVRSRTGKFIMTNIARQYGNVFMLLCKWLADNMPPGLKHPFPFTSINVNYDYGARIHRDVNNLGASLTKSCGCFAGGEPLYWCGDEGLTPLDRMCACLPSNSKSPLWLSMAHASSRRILSKGVNPSSSPQYKSSPPAKHPNDFVIDAPMLFPSR